jgi:hypothetical protein
MTFDDSVNKHLHESYFGGVRHYGPSPHERLTGVKRQVTFEDIDDEELLRNPEKYMAKLATQRAKFEREHDIASISDQGNLFLSLMKMLDDIYSEGGGVGTASKVKRVIPSSLKNVFFQAEYGDTDLDEEKLLQHIYNILDDNNIKYTVTDDDATDDILQKTEVLQEVKSILDALSIILNDYVPSNKNIDLLFNPDSSYRGSYIYEYPISTDIDHEWRRNWQPGEGGVNFDENGFRIRVTADRSLGKTIKISDINEDGVQSAQLLARHDSPTMPEALVLDLKVGDIKL